MMSSSSGQETGSGSGSSWTVSTSGGGTGSGGAGGEGVGQTDGSGGPTENPGPGGHRRAGWLVDVTSIGVLRKRTRTDRHLREPACKAILQRIWNLLGELIRSVGHNGFAGYLLSF
jgi:hypothetical protein